MTYGYLIFGGPPSYIDKAPASRIGGRLFGAESLGCKVHKFWNWLFVLTVCVCLHCFTEGLPT